MSLKEDKRRWKRKRAALFIAQRKCCYLCCKRMYPGNGSTDDHVTPKSLGGRRENNILLAHRKCNARKADRAPFPCEVLFLAAINEVLAA